jgi:hypothetical protein
MGTFKIGQFALVFLVLSSTAFAGPLDFTKPKLELTTKPTVSPVSPLVAKHIEYAKYLFKDHWQEHLADITKEWNANMGSSDPSDLDSVPGFNNFFSFVRETNPAMLAHFIAMNDYLKQASTANEAIRKAVDDGNGDAFINAFYQLFPMALQLNRTLDEARPRILAAADIYGVKIDAIDYTVQSFDGIQNAFGNNIFGDLKAMAQKFSDMYDPFKDADINDVYLGEFQLMIEKASFSYKKDGKKEFVAFVNFGKYSFHPWGGNYGGGDGAIASESFQFLDY